jgi:ATP-dependent helicase HrpB
MAGPVLFLRRVNLRSTEIDTEMQGDDGLISDAALAATAAVWLAPALADKTSLSAFAADDFTQTLHALLPWNLARGLEAEAPTHFTAPSGSSVPIDYEAEGGPKLAIRVQELFGLDQHPAIAGGRTPLLAAHGCRLHIGRCR